MSDAEETVVEKKRGRPPAGDKKEVIFNYCSGFRLLILLSFYFSLTEEGGKKIFITDRKWCGAQTRTW